MREAADAEDPTALPEADLRFHEALVSASGSRRLVRMTHTLLIETRMCLSALQRTDASADKRVAEHDRICEAIRTGEESTVLELLEAHMEDAVQHLAPGTSLHAGTT